jgi:glyoxylase-like metal-dependent hydrolase (beta-lactamase superfamily II)
MNERALLAALRDEGVRLLAILNTHGHPDHTYANAAVKVATRARLAIGRLDAYRLDRRTRPSAARPDKTPEVVELMDAVPDSEPDDLLDEGRLTYLADVRIEALHTPGHTEGSTCFYLPDDGALFSGDVLFAGAVGRVDQPGGDASAMERSLERVAALPPATTVYPGHGPSTTIGAELPWLRGFRF